MTNAVAPTTDTELLPLLTKASELAPEFCLREQTQGNHTRFVLGGLGYTIDIVNGQEISELDYAALQWALQGAISERKIFLEQYHHNNCSPQQSLSRLRKYELESEGLSPNRAIALLSAFVSALEGQS